jgi:hypothetical protein
LGLVVLEVQALKALILYFQPLLLLVVEMLFKLVRAQLAALAEETKVETQELPGLETKGDIVRQKVTMVALVLPVVRQAVAVVLAQLAEPVLTAH